jgi:hypothetical protein
MILFEISTIFPMLAPTHVFSVSMTEEFADKPMIHWHCGSD